MSIPDRIKIRECIGKYATLDKDVQNGAGQFIQKGSAVRVVGVGRSLHIETIPCQICGQHCFVRDVNKSSLTLVENSDEVILPSAKVDGGSLERKVGSWYLNCRHGSEFFGKHYCSNCGRYGTTARREDLVTAYCPHCGSEMHRVEIESGEFKRM